jgi:L-alanine-DL-glutamate epimerase-like enolase superfamily enzyme
MKITSLQRWTLNVPFYCDRVRRAMHRAGTHGERVCVYRLETDTGVVGYGEDRARDAPADLTGANPFALINDDSIGMGPQMAVLDVAGKAAGVPAHRLLGDQVRDRCPLSWWDIDMAAPDWVAEAEESVRRGYTSFKMKARPWFDIVQQVQAVAAVVPADYRFDLDFNGFLLDQARAEIVLSELDQIPNVGMYESPFRLHTDLDGARVLREQVRKPLIEHFREEVLHARCCDGFVIGGGPTKLRRCATLAAEFNKPFWLQIVGSGITAAYALQIGSVCSHAQLPYITCHELWENSLLQQPLQAVDGYVAVPDGPGLGIQVDEDAIARYRVDPDEPTPKQRYMEQKRILRISWPGAAGAQRVLEFSAEDIYQRQFSQGNIPGFMPGVHLDVIEDDGSAAFGAAHDKILARGR